MYAYAKFMSLKAADANWAAFRCVKPNGAVTGSTGDVIYGIVTENGVVGNGEVGTVQVAGEGYVEVGGAVSVDALLTGGANGRAVAATIGTNQPFLMALEASSAAGDVIRVKFL